MIIRLYGIYDEKALAFRTPFFMPTLGMAVRAFENLKEDKKTEIGLNPEDYTLWFLGAFDDQTGAFVPAQTITCVVPREDGTVPRIGIDPLGKEAMSIAELEAAGFSFEDEIGPDEVEKMEALKPNRPDALGDVQ